MKTEKMIDFKVKEKFEKTPYREFFQMSITMPPWIKKICQENKEKFQVFPKILRECYEKGQTIQYTGRVNKEEMEKSIKISEKTIEFIQESRKFGISISYEHSIFCLRTMEYVHHVIMESSNLKTKTASYLKEMKKDVEEFNKEIDKFNEKLNNLRNRKEKDQPNGCLLSMFDNGFMITSSITIEDVEKRSKEIGLPLQKFFIKKFPNYTWAELIELVSRMKGKIDILQKKAISLYGRKLDIQLIPYKYEN